MAKEENVIKYYVLCNKLKSIIRTGWQDWHINKERVESVAEHIYGTQMLALAMYSEYKYDIDIQKVLTMLAIHELEEIIIGDLTLYQITPEEKTRKGHQAIEKVLSSLLDKEILKELIIEFDNKETKEANFAFQCDKLECDLQSKLYDEECHVDVNNQKEINENQIIKEYIAKGMTWSDIWMTQGRNRYNYDLPFKEVSEFAQKHNISKYKK